MPTPLERVRNGRIALLVDEPFFGTLLMSLKLVEDKTRPTFSTDGRTLNYNPAYLATLNDRQLNTILAHEVMHPALLHPFRLGQRDLRRANVAADYVVNNFLDTYNQQAADLDAAAGRPRREVPFPFTGPLANALLDHKYDGKSFEEVYALLGEKKDKEGSGAGGQGSGGPGSGQPGDPSDPSDSPSSPGEFTAAPGKQEDRDEAQAEWKVAMQNAAMAAKSQGRAPACVARLLGDLLEPTVHWRDHLREFLTAVAQDDYSFTKPNRRYSGTRCILPGLHSPRLGKIICAVDTSGSIDGEQFAAFMTEVNTIFFDCRPELLIVAQCDAAVHDWQEVQPFDDLQIKCNGGGGGTSFRPVFDRANEEAEPPVALIYLTDLDGSFPDYTPSYPVLWAVTGRKTRAPFGHVISI